MTTITVNESDRIIIAESLEGWIEYRFSDIPGNEKEIYLHIETDRPALLRKLQVDNFNLKRSLTRISNCNDMATAREYAIEALKEPTV